MENNKLLSDSRSHFAGGRSPRLADLHTDPNSGMLITDRSGSKHENALDQIVSNTKNLKIKNNKKERKYKNNNVRLHIEKGLTYKNDKLSLKQERALARVAKYDSMMLTSGVAGVMMREILQLPHELQKCIFSYVYVHPVRSRVGKSLDVAISCIAGVRRALRGRINRVPMTNGVRIRLGDSMMHLRPSYFTDGLFNETETFDTLLLMIINNLHIADDLYNWDATVPWRVSLYNPTKLLDRRVGRRLRDHITLWMNTGFVNGLIRSIGAVAGLMYSRNFYGDEYVNMPGGGYVTQESDLETAGFASDSLLQHLYGYECDQVTPYQYIRGTALVFLVSWVFMMVRAFLLLPHMIFSGMLYPQEELAQAMRPIIVEGNLCRNILVCLYAGYWILLNFTCRTVETSGVGEELVRWHNNILQLQEERRLRREICDYEFFYADSFMCVETPEVFSYGRSGTRVLADFRKLGQDIVGNLPKIGTVVKVSAGVSISALAGIGVGVLVAISVASTSSSFKEAAKFRNRLRGFYGEEARAATISELTAWADECDRELDSDYLLLADVETSGDPEDHLIQLLGHLTTTDEEGVILRDILLMSLQLMYATTAFDAAIAVARTINNLSRGIPIPSVTNGLIESWFKELKFGTATTAGEGELVNKMAKLVGGGSLEDIVTTDQALLVREFIYRFAKYLQVPYVFSIDKITDLGELAFTTVSLFMSIITTYIGYRSGIPFSFHSPVIGLMERISKYTEGAVNVVKNFKEPLIGASYRNMEGAQIIKEIDKLVLFENRPTKTAMLLRERAMIVAHLKELQSIASSMDRPMPYGIMLCGDPGTGKSLLEIWLIDNVIHENNLPISPMNIVGMIPDSKGRGETIRAHHTVIRLGDLGKTRRTWQSVDWELVMKMIDPSPYTVEASEMANKGVYIVPLIVTASSNNYDPSSATETIGSNIQTRDGVYRRFKTAAVFKKIVADINISGDVLEDIFRRNAFEEYDALVEITLLIHGNVVEAIKSIYPTAMFSTHDDQNMTRARITLRQLVGWVRTNSREHFSASGKIGLLKDRAPCKCCGSRFLCTKGVETSFTTEVTNTFIQRVKEKYNLYTLWVSDPPPVMTPVQQKADIVPVINLFGIIVLLILIGAMRYVHAHFNVLVVVSFLVPYSILFLIIIYAFYEILGFDSTRIDAIFELLILLLAQRVFGYSWLRRVKARALSFAIVHPKQYSILELLTKISVFTGFGLVAYKYWVPRTVTSGRGLPTWYPPGVTNETPLAWLFNQAERSRTPERLIHDVQGIQAIVASYETADGKPKICVGTLMPPYVLVPYHFVRDMKGEKILQIIGSPVSGALAKINVKFKMSEWHQVSNIDAALIAIESFPCSRKWEYLMEDSGDMAGSCDITIVGVNQTDPFILQTTGTFVNDSGHPSLRYSIPSVSVPVTLKEGTSGSAYIAIQGQRAVFVGIQVTTNPQWNFSHCHIVTLRDIRVCMDKFSTKRKVTSLDIKFEELHPKAAVANVQNGNIVLGSLNKGRRSARNSAVSSPLAPYFSKLWKEVNGDDYMLRDVSASIKSDGAYNGPFEYAMKFATLDKDCIIPSYDSLYAEVEFLLLHIYDSASTKRVVSDPVGWDIAHNGTADNIIRKITLSKAAGPPDGGKRGDYAYVNEQGRICPTVSEEIELNDFEAAVLNGEIHYMVAQSFIKTNEVGKVGSIARIINNVDRKHYMLARKYLADLVIVLRLEWELSGSAVGIAMSRESDVRRLITHLGTNPLLDLDYSKWDKRMLAVVIRIVFTVLAAIYDQLDCPKTAIICRHFSEVLANPVLDMNGDYIIALYSWLSGFFATSDINVLLNLVTLFHCWVVSGHNWHEFFEKVCKALYGDDALVAMPEGFTFEDIQRGALQLNQRVTSGVTKDGVGILGTIYDVSFLKRRFRYTDGHWFAPLLPQSALKAVMYSTINIEEKIKLEAVLRSLLLEGYLAGFEVFKSYESAAKEASIALGLQPPPEYTYYNAWYMEGSTDLEQFYIEP